MVYVDNDDKDKHETFLSSDSNTMPSLFLSLFPFIHSFTHSFSFNSHSLSISHPAYFLSGWIRRFCFVIMWNFQSLISTTKAVSKPFFHPRLSKKLKGRTGTELFGFLWKFFTYLPGLVDNDIHCLLSHRKLRKCESNVIVWKPLFPVKIYN